MAWIRLDDDIADHPKVLSAGPVAFALYIAMLCQANRFLTNGFLSTQMVKANRNVVSPLKWAERLVNAGLWERAEGGFQIHDYHVYQSSADEIKAKREADRLRKASGKNPNGIEVESERNPARSRALGCSSGSLCTSSSSEKRKDLTERFEAFWRVYPRKVGKDAAWKAWCKRCPSKELTAVIVAKLAEQRQSDQWLKDGGQYIPNPATWINQGRWQDEPVELPTLTERTIRTAKLAGALGNS